MSRPGSRCAARGAVQNVQPPHEGQEDQGLVKDLPLQRVKKPGPKNFRITYRPLPPAISNIPPATTEGDLKSLFSSISGVIKEFKFIQKDCKMALIQTGSMEEASRHSSTCTTTTCVRTTT
ncbi:hypothetical protein CB1_000305019 [Camelus ferus]|nr:hypothetical protein CB1_000305019 [Camelus ferus]